MSFQTDFGHTLFIEVMFEYNADFVLVHKCYIAERGYTALIFLISALVSIGGLAEGLIYGCQPWGVLHLQNRIGGIIRTLIIRVIRIEGFYCPLEAVIQICPGTVYNFLIVGIILVGFIISVIIIVIIFVVIIIVIPGIRSRAGPGRACNGKNYSKQDSQNHKYHKGYNHYDQGCIIFRFRWLGIYIGRIGSRSAGYAAGALHSLP